VTDLREQLERGLADRYRIERELGRGGMATVYLARDIRHKRPVALKVLHPELAATLGPERFQREIELAAGLQHPHILSVHDSGETAGQLWFTMPFVEGESLRDRLNRQKQLPIEDALRITTEAARALDYAHRHGVIHRDIKPENILLTKEGDTLVADLGIGRALDTAGEDKLTQTGLVVGTPAYMSPEQAAGERELDGRSDLYSLGAVLYEMLAGEPPHSGPTVQAIMARRFMGDVPRVREARPTVPEAVEQALVKALARVPADRFQTAADFARALAPSTIITPTAVAPVQSTPTQGVTPAPPPAPTRPRPRQFAAPAFVLGLLVMASMGMLLLLRNHRATEDSGTGPKRLAVLPFENLGGPEEEYFADGITDEVRGKLAALPGLQVTARSSSSQYKKAPKSPHQVGQELGVQYLLTGTVRWEKGEGGRNRVRVSPELVQVTTGSTKWQEPFEAPLTDVFQVQADIAGRVAQALDVALGAGERQTLAEKPTQNLTAYDAYLKGEEVSSALGTSNPAAIRQALGHYEKAVDLDSTFALAWARLSQAHALLYFLTAPTPQEGETARAAAERALALAPKRPEGRLALGDYHYRVAHDYARALEQYALGQRIAPRDADLLVGTALTEQTLGRWESALQHLQRAQTLDPRSVNTARRLARTLLWLRRYPEALRACDQGLALAPASPELHENKAMIYLAQGDLAGAHAVLRAAPKELDPTTLVTFVGTFWDLPWVLDEEQQRLLLGLSPTAFDDNRANWGIVLAQTYAARGDQAHARVYADSSRLAFEEQLRATPEDAQLHSLHGVALAYLGRKAEAVREGERGLELQPITKDAYSGAYNQHQLARIYLLVGQPEKALDQLEPLLKIPYYLSPGWLKIDPNFAPLRGNPRFERLVKGS
jgi:serine/threonine-protein kinase